MYTHLLSSQATLSPLHLLQVPPSRYRVTIHHLPSLPPDLHYHKRKQEEKNNNDLKRKYRNRDPNSKNENHSNKSFSRRGKKYETSAAPQSASLFPRRRHLSLQPPSSTTDNSQSGDALDRSVALPRAERGVCGR